MALCFRVVILVPGVFQSGLQARHAKSYLPTAMSNGFPDGSGRPIKQEQWGREDSMTCKVPAAAPAEIPVCRIQSQVYSSFDQIAY